jgi:hypothetical protein
VSGASRQAPLALAEGGALPTCSICLLPHTSSCSCTSWSSWSSTCCIPPAVLASRLTPAVMAAYVRQETPEQ